MNLLHVDKKAKKITDALAHSADVLLLRVKSLDGVLRGIESSQSSGTLLLGEFKLPGGATVHPSHVMIEGSGEAKPCPTHSTLDLSITSEYSSMRNSEILEVSISCVGCLFEPLQA